MAIADVAEYAHLSAADVEALAVELDAIRLDIEDSRGANDRAYIQRTIAVQRCLDLAARVVIGAGRRSARGVIQQPIRHVYRRKRPTPFPSRTAQSRHQSQLGVDGLLVPHIG